MQSLPPLAIPVTIVMAVVFVGAIIAFLRDRGRFSGYKNLMADALRLGKSLSGEVFRDGQDLVVSGTYSNRPVQVRFSHSENTPGLNIRLGAPSNINLFLGPRSAKAKEGRILLRTPDEMFNTRVEARSDHPTQAKLLLSSRGVMPALTKLCRSSNTYIRVTTGMVELIDLAPPSPSTVTNVRVQLESLNALAAPLAEMPGAEKVRVEPLKRERRLMLRAAIAAGVVAAAGAVLIAVQSSKTPAHSQIMRKDVSAEIARTDAAIIPGANKWHVASESSFDPDGTTWLRAQKIAVAGRVSADFAGAGAQSDAAYVLESSGEKKRVVILSHSERIYDASFNYVGIAARVPKAVISSIEWAGTPPANPDGDGLLLTRAPHDRASGIIIFRQGGRIISAVPKDYQTIRLE
ncbi:MAG TPA: hypothetical protein VD837_04225 [Terriglobales bacterium]|nr:hypothetical protein [Terriglobales bacterium]